MGEEMTYRITYTLTQADIDSGGVENTATVTGSTPLGGTVSDISDSGAGDGSTPTIAGITQIDSMEATKATDGVPTRIAPDVYEVTFDMSVTNTGNVTQTEMVIEDDLTAFLAPSAVLIAVDAPVDAGFDAGSANAGYDGLIDVALMSGDTALAPGSTGSITLTLRYNTAAGFPEGTNTLSVTSARISVPVTATATAIIGADPDIFATKSVAPATARIGEVVTYTLSFENRLDTAEANLTMVDAMPAGLAYVPDSATYNGAATPAPAQVGRNLEWQNVTLAPHEIVTLTVEARVTGGSGSLTNQAYMLDPSGAQVSNVASATLRLPVEPVFDCTDIIGKVFDDRNMNGVQDGPNGQVAGITDQEYQGGKFVTAPIVEQTGEPGLPRVRLSTVTGTLITTDEYGRYSVPCAALPAGTGSNFLLKLDTRTLPTGYQVTTENPRVMRVTPGRMTRMNFGAALANVIEIDLMDAAFSAGSNQPTAGLIAGIDQLVTGLEKAPSTLQLTYYRRGESPALARQRLDMVERLIRERWTGRGTYRLNIQRSIARVQ